MLTNLNRLKRPRRTQQGVVMIMVLLLMGVMSIVGALSLRNSAITEQVSNNFRVAAVAQQAAELALKYCESVAVDQAGVQYAAERTKILAATITGAITAGAWNNTATWTNSANYISISNSYSLSPNVDTVKFRHAPQCVIERLNSPSGRGFVITARGFGNDARFSATNGVTFGSEAWVQSVLFE
jgi:type IV pilus assembly protein PilX